MTDDEEIQQIFLVEDSMDEFVDLPMTSRKSPYQTIQDVDNSRKSSQHEDEADATASYLSQCLATSMLYSAIPQDKIQLIEKLESLDDEFGSSFELEMNSINLEKTGANSSELHAIPKLKSMDAQAVVENPFLDEDFPLVMDSFSSEEIEAKTVNGVNDFSEPDDIAIPDIDNLDHFGSDPSVDLLAARDTSAFDCFDE